MRTHALTLGALGILALGGIALASSESGQSQADTALTPEQIAGIMTTAGYTLDEFEIEDGNIEAEGERGGASWEVVIDGRTGTILSAEQDD